MKIAPEATSAKETVAFVESLKQENKSLKEKLEPLVKFFERMNKNMNEQLKAKLAVIFPTLYPKQPSLERNPKKCKTKLPKFKRLSTGHLRLTFTKHKKRANVVTIEDIKAGRARLQRTPSKTKKQ